MIMIKDKSGGITIQMTAREVASYHSIQDKQNDGLKYIQSIHGQLKKGMEKLRDVRSGEIDL